MSEKGEYNEPASSFGPAGTTDGLRPDPETPAGHDANHGEIDDAHRADSAYQQANTAGTIAEIEIKLLGKPDVVDAAYTSAALKHYNPDGAERSELQATYFDTPDSELLQRGWALRVRRSGAAQHTMTLKTPVGAHGANAFTRNEWNKSVEGNWLDRETLTAWLRELGEQNVDVASLQPVFRTDIIRRTIKLTSPHGVVELAADNGHVFADTRSMPVSEIELELVSGSPVAIFEIAQDIVAALPVRPAVQSKSARGYDLALGRTPAAVKACQISADSGSRLDEALYTALNSMFSHALANLAAAENASSPDGIHQLRVALRRLRSLLAVIDAMAPSGVCAGLRADAKWLMSELGHARNWDVFATGIIREAQAACSPHVDFSSLEELVKHLRSEAQEQARAALNSPQASQFLIALGGWIACRGWRQNASVEALALLVKPARHMARLILARRHQSVLKKGRNFRRLDAASLHETRLALKKLRYVVEVFQPFSPPSHGGHRFARQLASLQDAFGRYNDLHSAIGMLQVIRKSRSRGGPERALAIGATYGWQAAEERIVLEVLQKRWAKFRAAPGPQD